MSLRPGTVNFQEKWKSLSETILAVVKLSPVNTVTWNDHYSDIYALCEAFPVSFAEKLFTETQSLLAGFVEELHQVLMNLSFVPLLSGYRQHWLKYHQGAKYLDNLFSYFNRVPLRKYKPSESNPYQVGVASIAKTEPSDDVPIQIRYMALRVWKKGILDKMRSQIVTTLLQQIKKERDGEEVDMTMIRDIVSSFIEVEEKSGQSNLLYYKEVFETPFLAETGQYYRGEASGMVVSLTCSQYMKNVVARLQGAQRTGSRFLHQTSVTKFVRECESRLVVDYKDDYLYTHTRTMVREEQREDLTNLYLLLHSIPKAVQPVVAEFEAHVTEQGNQALRQLYEDKSYSVSDFMGVVLKIHGKYREMVTSVFSSHKDFMSALDRACKTFVNSPERPNHTSKAPQLLARYCDQLLRKSSKSSGVGGDVEDSLQHAITVFYYIEEKDMFQRFYSRMLSRRLVHGVSLSMEAEENMIQKLKHACGYEYTSRLQRMVVDVHLSVDTVTAFNKHLESMGKSLPISFTAMVLQSATWPLQPNNSSPLLPTHPTEAMAAFEKFYTGKHNGRTLTWLHHHSQADLKLGYLKKPYMVCVTTYQMAVLYAYNEEDSYDLSTICRHTQLPEDEVKTTLHTLVESKLILRGSGEKGGVAEGAVYSLNKGYFNKRTKFKIAAAAQKETQQDIDRTVYSVSEDRKLYIQAAIVRLMKARKQLQHNQLIQETISQVKSRFSPSVHMIKKCIETLMEKQYLQRMEGSKDTYQYVA